MKPPRIIYHPAPSPGLDGELHEVRPIDLGRDPKRALAWIRRRLGLITDSETAGLRFEARRLPDTSPVETQGGVLPVVPVKPQALPVPPPRRELSSEELLAALESDPRLRPTDRRD